MLLYPSTPQSIGMLVWIDTTYRQTNSTVRCLSVCLAVSTAALTIHVIRFMKKMRKNRLKWSYLDQELISYSNSSCRSCCCWGYRFQNRSRRNLARMLLAWIAYASTDGVEFSIWRHTFKMTAMTSFYVKKVLTPGEWTRSVCLAPMQYIATFLFIGALAAD